VTDSWNVLGKDLLQANVVFNFTVSCTELNCSVLIVTDMWHVVLKIWVLGVVMLSSRVIDSWHLEGTHCLHLQESLSALGPGDLFLVMCGIHLPSFGQFHFPIKIYLL